MRLMEGEHVGPFNLGNPGEFTMLELARVSLLCGWITFLQYVSGFLFHAFSFRKELAYAAFYYS